jgi:iron complex outermembrane recepter protein
VIRARGLRRALACAGALLALAGPAHASAAPCTAEDGAEASPPRRHPPPLDRALVFHARDLALRDALDRLAQAARIRISYSAELLPLERRVCVSRTTTTVGDALDELLRDTPVEAVVAGADHVVLALRRRAQAEPAADAEAREDLGRTVELERIVVTGSAAGGPQPALPIALDVIGPEQLERQGTAPLARVLSASGGGVWAWEQPPASMMARYGSIRGASSFGVSHPKVFIDGIEVANPLLATQISPEAVERIEVIRGPQGAALYGTDAISGVVNIVTRHENPGTGAPRLRIRTGVGGAASAYGAPAALAQEHALALRVGSSVRSAGVDVGIGGLGDYVPQGASRYLMASANGRMVGPRAILTGTGRFYAASGGGGALGATADLRAQRVRQYTVGGSLRFAPDAVWTHTLIAGMDGGRLSGVPAEGTPLPSPAQVLLQASEGGADRGTLRWSSVARVRDGGRAAVSVTLAAEHSTLREEGTGAPWPALGRLPAGPWVSWTRTTGVVAQGNYALDDRLYLTGGMRMERNPGLNALSRYPVLPVLGGAWITEIGGAALKLRAAYGKGIRPARTARRDHGYGAYPQLGAGGLAPEEQTGIEGGFDLSFGALTLHATAYDQLATGLIQRVAMPWDTLGGGHGTPGVLQNVGEISNRGWEMQSAADFGRLSLEGGFAYVDSRVRRVAAGYTGDLRAGDRMLEVPERTATLTAAWTGARWSGSLTAYRAFDWVNYDRVVLARDFSESGAEEMAGAELRGYWRGYDGVTRLNATVSAALRGGVVLVLSGENLLDYQRGEPDNVTILPGRTLTLGFRAAF